MRKWQLIFWKVGRLRWLIIMLIMALSFCLISMTLEAPGLINPELLFSRPFAHFHFFDEKDKDQRLEQQQILDRKLWNQRWNSQGKAQLLARQRTKEAAARSQNMKRKAYQRPQWEAWIVNHSKKNSRDYRELDEQPLKKKPFLESKGAMSELKLSAQEAWVAGREAWTVVEGAFSPGNGSFPRQNLDKTLSCPMEISMTGEELAKKVGRIILPCGLAKGSSITVMAVPLAGDIQEVPVNQTETGSSQFILELRTSNLGDSEDASRLLHVNPRLKGDWRRKPVIEYNTCYRGQWGLRQRCAGWKTPDYDDGTGLIRCEEWFRDGEEQKQLKTTSWLDKLLGRPTKTAKLWGFPFSVGRFFVLTIRAGWEGYHLAVDGRHISLFPYQKDFNLEDATDLYVHGNIDLHAVVITSLPFHPSFSSEKDLKEFERWKAPPMAKGPISLFIGIISKSTNFAERMAIRKTWMQSDSIRSAKVVARFFVALDADKNVNIQIKQEADFFGDVVILTYMDQYNLVLLKTIAICEYGVHKMSAQYIMKCDDDTFVWLEGILTELKALPHEHSLYLGNINQFHRPLRVGKWAVSYEEWPEDEYPLYADGLGYIITADIAGYVVSQHEKGELQLFKMEDVSMGLWVSQFAQSKTVNYVNRAKFCHWGCIDGYFTAHYQSPQQMSCLWDKLSHGEAKCCNM
ncbi:hypothetical protein O6H91_02G047500 [Diphasiastrum complanatum]|uniref:Uncharacterized protein n=1 Tax=Diphasiastrum complanatum TaxID=34168 RepID=A0ACC2EFG2_DIPCM|nr:hypothetical protein O6H91_02G047500 [Diphasiastrum complanatum]